MSITACLIVRNEEQHLRQCLASLARHVNSILVVDTGSTDNTISIALEHQAQVFEHAWRDDFARARNQALDYAQGEWILYIDADETLHAADDDLSVLNNPKAVAATVSFRAASHLTCYPEHRLFRNRPDLRFISVIHETIMPGIQSIIAREGLEVVRSGAHIEHHGYEGDLTHKHQRNHPMLLRAVEEDPERVYLWHALGECELGLGDEAAAERAWREALALVRHHPGRPENALVYADMLSLPQARRNDGINDLETLLTEARKHHGNDPLIKWWLAQHCVFTGQTKQSRRLLGELLHTDSHSSPDCILAYDQRLFGAMSHALMGNSWMLEGNACAALACYEKAVACDPENREYRLKRDLAFAQNAA